MSEARSEEATPKTERRARERGRAWQSRDLTLGAALLGAALAIRVGGDALAARLGSLMRAPIAAIEGGVAPDDALVAAVTDGALLIAPVLVVILALATLVSALQVGPLFATRAIEADAARLDPTARFAELFGARAWATLGMTLARLSLASLVALATLGEALPGIATLSRQPEAAAFAAGVSVIAALLLRVGLLMLALGAVDAVLERALYRRSLRMTRRERERERRESEGDEHLVRERARVAAEARDHDVDESVPLARLVVGDGDVVVALAYDEADPDAVPRLVASGRGLVGDRILSLAEAHRVAVAIDPELAAQLRIVPLGHPIPEALYGSVARLMHDARAAGASP